MLLILCTNSRLDRNINSDSLITSILSMQTFMLKLPSEADMLPSEATEADMLA
jgi:hypothetical protein